MSNLKRIAVLVCDIQKKTINQLYKKQPIINNINLLIEARYNIYNIQGIAAAEFYPEKLGN